MLQIADMDRNYYQDHALTLARHPSETDERMMVRLLAFVRHAHEALLFGRGLSSMDEPALWQKDLTGNIDLWIEVGQPEKKIFVAPAGAQNRSVSILMVAVAPTCGGHRTGRNSNGWKISRYEPATRREPCLRPALRSATCSCSAPFRRGRSGWGTGTTPCN